MSNTKQLMPVTGIGLVDKQTGGSGQYAQVEVTVHSLEPHDAPNTVTSAVVGATIPTAFIASVIEGVNEGLKHGPLSGYPVTGVAVTIVGGKIHCPVPTQQPRDIFASLIFTT